jgi:predicted DCC family thiol-disulfide oxidoreductase YuxK
MAGFSGYADYSYRDDPRVPAFDDRGPIVFMDGECALCSTCARLISRLDRSGEFRICRVQSATGRAVCAYYGLDPDDATTWLYLVDGAAYGSLDAIIRAGWRLGGIGRIMIVFRALPRGAQDWLYRRVARSRYRLFGRADMCETPDPALKARLME